MSSGMDPSYDAVVPKEERQNKAEESESLSKKGGQMRTITSSLGFHHINSLAVMIALSACGLVSIEDFAFVVFSLFYMYFLSKIAFPPHVSTSTEPPVFDENSQKILRVYALVAAVIGLFLPIAYVFEGIFEGDREGIKAATPHLFLLAAQVFMEGVAFGGNFSIPIQVFVPVFYNSRRIFTLVAWLKAEFYQVELEEFSSSSRRLYIGRSLAIANMGLWCFNLFGFLLPFYLPKAFKIHYSRLNKDKQ